MTQAFGKQVYGKEIAMTVIGAGSYGTSLAISLARNGENVVIWGHEADHMERLENDRANHEFLPGIDFPDTLIVETDLEKAVHASRDLLVVVPSHVFGIVLKSLQPHLRDDTRICWATKGLEPETGRLLKEVAHDVIGEDYSLAVLSGPTFAKELAMGMPTAISVASPDDQFVSDLQEKIHCSKTFRVYANSDFIGMQLGGAVKNVIAIGAGMSDGIGFGANARTALITRGLAEMTRLGVALGAQKETFMGMAGLGDLVLTCTDNQSRNRRFGLALGTGKMLIPLKTKLAKWLKATATPKRCGCWQNASASRCRSLTKSIKYCIKEKMHVWPRKIYWREIRNQRCKKSRV